MSTSRLASVGPEDRGPASQLSPLPSVTRLPLPPESFSAYEPVLFLTLRTWPMAL